MAYTSVLEISSQFLNVRISWKDFETHEVKCLDHLTYKSTFKENFMMNIILVVFVLNSIKN